MSSKPPPDSPAADRHRDLRQLPQVDAALRHPAAATPIERYGRPRVVEALRAGLDRAREQVLAGEDPPDVPTLLAQASSRLAAQRRPTVRRVINATGVLLHTNLGRAPLSAAARRAVVGASGYATVEYDLDQGERGSRTAHVGALAAEACGTEAATVVNNGAAALMLVLAALAQGREVLVSRGELIEIGGSYRLPDVMGASGAVLREVGTTNRTRTADYEAAAGPDTALILKVHRSNFRIEGFTEEAPASELSRLSAELGIPFVHDLGSGLLHEQVEGPLAGEPSVDGALAAGADLVLFSGDKLLGGPQAGIIAGRSGLVESCRRHALARAVRIDKLQRAALEATLESHLRAGGVLPMDLPLGAMLSTSTADLERRAEELASQIGPAAKATPCAAVVGGGAVPGGEVDSWGVALTTDDPDQLAADLRSQSPPVIGRVEDGRLLLDLRTVAPSDDGDVLDLVLSVLQA